MLTRSVISGALASLGLMALLSPALFYVLILVMLFAFVGRLFGTPVNLAELAYTIVPGLVAVATSAVAAGFVAGGMASVDRGRHGSAAALLGLVLALTLGLVEGVLNPPLLGLGIAIGAVLAIPVALVCGRLGVLVAPRVQVAREVAPMPVPVPAEARRPRVLLPAAGQKGGERSDDTR